METKIRPILQTRKLRPKKVKSLAQITQLTNGRVGNLPSRPLDVLYALYL